MFLKILKKRLNSDWLLYLISYFEIWMDVSAILFWHIGIVNMIFTFKDICLNTNGLSNSSWRACAEDLFSVLSVTNIFKEAKYFELRLQTENISKVCIDVVCVM